MAPESTTCESHFAREIISLLKWIKVEKLVLHSSSTHLRVPIHPSAKKDLNNAKKEVKRALEVGENEKVAMPRGKYNSYTP